MDRDSPRAGARTRRGIHRGSRAAREGLGPPARRRARRSPPGSGSVAHRGRSALRGRDPVYLELAVEMAPLDAELLRRLRHVPVELAQLAEDVRALERLARLLERLFLLGVLCSLRGVPRPERG